MTTRIPPAFGGSTVPGSDWSSTTQPKTQTLAINNGDVVLVFGGTESPATTLSAPTGGPNTAAALQAVDATGYCGGYAWAVSGAIELQVTSPGTLPSGTAGLAYSQTFTAVGGTGTGYTWSVSSGSLPVWASLNSSTGVISGTPTTGETGTTTFTVEVTDSASNTATKSVSITINSSSVAPDGPTGSWTLAWHDEFDNTSGMSGHTNGLANTLWNVGWYYGPSSPGGAGYTGKSKTASNGGGAVEFYGPGALSFPSGGGMDMSTYASGAGPDGASYTNGSFSSTQESGGVNTAGIMNIMPNTSYTVPSAIEGTVIQAAHIVIEVECQFAGPNDAAGAGAAAGYWQYIGFYNCGDCSTPDYPNSASWTQEIDVWEEVGGEGSTGADFFTTFHAASSYGSVVSIPSSFASTDMSLAMHKYTMEFTDTTMTLWVDGTQVSTVTPTSAEVSAQWATPMYFNMQFQVFSGCTATGATYDGAVATPWKVNYVRVFTQ